MFYIIFNSLTKLFSNLYLAKFLDISAKPFCFKVLNLLSFTFSWTIARKTVRSSLKPWLVKKKAETIVSARYCEQCSAWTYKIKVQVHRANQRHVTYVRESPVDIRDISGNYSVFRSFSTYATCVRVSQSVSHYAASSRDSLP